MNKYIRFFVYNAFRLYDVHKRNALYFYLLFKVRVDENGELDYYA